MKEFGYANLFDKPESFINCLKQIGLILFEIYTTLKNRWNNLKN